MASSSRSSAGSCCLSFLQFSVQDFRGPLSFSSRSREWCHWMYRCKLLWAIYCQQVTNCVELCACTSDREAPLVRVKLVRVTDNGNPDSDSCLCERSLVSHPTRHITDHFLEESFQAVICTGTDNIKSTAEKSY